MIDVKRIEIVIDAAHTPALLTILKVVGMPGYTLVRDVQGTGDRGERGGDGLTDAFRNCYLIIAVPEEAAEVIIESTRPLLERYGGMCLVSDAKWLKH